jgi:hypothetical protein
MSRISCGSVCVDPALHPRGSRHPGNPEGRGGQVEQADSHYPLLRAFLPGVSFPLFFLKMQVIARPFF